MIGPSLTLTLALILFVSLGAAILGRYLKKSAIIFYIIFGILVSNLLERTGTSHGFLEPLANLGIVFLLFTIGMEFSLERLKRAGRLIVTSSIGQIMINGTLLSFVTLIISQNLFLSVFLGFSLAMSSTAIVGKLLSEKGEDSSLSGEITLSTLVLQDIVGVVLITLLTMANYSVGQTGQSTLWLILQKGAVVVVSFVVLTQLIAFILNRFKLNREELSLFVFGVVFLLIGVFSWMGIPETTAGFLIGVILTHRVEQHEIFAQVRVFRDVLLVLFFFFLGTFINSFGPGMVIWALVLAVGIMLLKFLIGFLLYVVQGMHQKTAFWVAFDLMQIGEFAFIVMTLMNQGRLITGGFHQLILMTVIWSLVIFSFIYKKKPDLYKLFKTRITDRVDILRKLSAQGNKLVFDQLSFSDHIVLCGYGRVGAYLGHGLLLSNIPLVVIDTNDETIKKLLKRGVKAIYGDATEPDILDYAQVDKAKFLIVSVPDPIEQERIIMEGRRMNRNLTIITRTHLTNELRHLKALGVELIYQPEFEAALSMLKKILRIYSIEKEEIKKRLKYLKMEHGT